MQVRARLSKTRALQRTQVGEANIPYAASKNATATLAQGLYYEIKNKGIDVLDYQPGYVATNLVAGIGS